MLAKFFYPYLEMLVGAAWTIRQVLDGMGVAPSTCQNAPACAPLACPCWSPSELTLTVVGFMVPIVAGILGVWLTTGYVLWRKRGAALALAFALVPGLLNSCEMWRVPSAVPDVYKVGGDGALGSVWGMVMLVVLAALSGWCVMLILVDIVAFGDRFWHAYDHLWYSTGLLAGVFFVADSKVSQDARDFQDNAKVVQGASSYLLKQVQEYEAWCAAHAQTDKISCNWAFTVQQRLLDISTNDAGLYPEFGPKTENALYGNWDSAATDAQVTEIRREIDQYNSARCPIKKLNDRMYRSAPTTSKCLHTPAGYCRVHQRPISGAFRPDHTGDMLVLDDCIVPTLVALRGLQEKIQLRAEKDAQQKYGKWLYYLVLSVVAGGRMANLTVKLTGMNLRSVDEAGRSLHLLKRIWGILAGGFRRLWTVAVAVLTFPGVVFARIVKRRA